MNAEIKRRLAPMSAMWSVLSALFILALWGMKSILSQKGIAFTVGQWIVYLAWLLWTLFGIALVWTFITEREPRAARVGTLIFGGISVVVAAVLAPLWIFP
jgi:hypothetical protein